MSENRKLYRIERPRYDSVYASYNFVVQVMNLPGRDFRWRDRVGFAIVEDAQAWIDEEIKNRIGEIQ